MGHTPHGCNFFFKKKTKPLKSTTKNLYLCFFTHKFKDLVPILTCVLSKLKTAQTNLPQVLGDNKNKTEKNLEKKNLNFITRTSMEVVNQYKLVYFTYVRDQIHVVTIQIAIHVGIYYQYTNRYFLYRRQHISPAGSILRRFGLLLLSI